jgi:hypothetical protein
MHKFATIMATLEQEQARTEECHPYSTLLATHTGTPATFIAATGDSLVGPGKTSGSPQKNSALLLQDASKRVMLCYVMVWYYMLLFD